jgi:gliding motility-associated-like protein
MSVNGVMPVISSTSAVAERLEIKDGATLTVQRALSIVTNSNTSPFHSCIVNGTINVNSTITITSNLTDGTSDAIRVLTGSVATFNMGASGIIRITKSSSNGIHNLGILTFNGNGRVQLQSSTLSSIVNEDDDAVFVNNITAPGRIECYGVSGSDGIDNVLGTFTNAGELVIYDIRDSGITHRAAAKKFINTATGNILLYRTSVPLANNTAITVNNTFQNAGKITIGRASDIRLFHYGFSLSDSLINTGTIIVENVGTKSICEHCSQNVQTTTQLPVLVNARDNNTCAANSTTAPNTNFSKGYIKLTKGSYVNTIDNQGVLLIQYNIPPVVPVTNLKNTGIIAYLDNEFSTSVSTYTVNQGLVINMSKIGCGEGYIPEVSETSPQGLPNFILDSLVLSTAPYSLLAIYDGTNGRMYYTSNLPTGSYQAYLVLHPSLCPNEKIYIPYSFDVQSPINWTLSTESALNASSNDGKANASAITNNGNTYNYTWDNGSSGNVVSSYNPFAHSVTVVDNNKCSAAKTFYVGDKSTCDVPTLTATVIDTCSGGNLTLNATITLDAGCALSAINGYLWTFVDFYTGDTTTYPSSSSTRTITGTSAGSWSVQAVIVEISPGSCACSGTGALTPTAFSNSISIKPTPPTPVINNNLPLTVCLGNSIGLSVTNAPLYLSGTNFLWYNAANNLIGFGPNYSLTVNTLNPVVLSIVATYNGCSTAPVFVTIYPDALPDAPALSATTYCLGGATTLTNSNTQSNYLTDWYLNPFGAPIGSGNTIVMNNPGANTIVYAVNTNTSTFCKSGFSTITLSPAATPAAPIVIPNPLNVCNGNTVLLWARSSSAGLIRWYDNISSNTPIAQSGVTAANDTSFYNYTVTTSGNKTFYVSFINPATGCESPRVPITINTPVVNSPQIVANRTNLCLGESTTLNAYGGSGSYIWYGPTGNQINTGSTIQIQGTLVDTLFYYVTSEINGCTGNFDTARIIVRPDPSFVFVDLQNACFNACNGSIHIGVNQSPVVYNWSNIGLNNISSINNLCPGNYSVTVNNTWGCNVDTTLNVSQTGPFSLQGMVTPISCHNQDDGSINIQVNSAFSSTYVYLWNNGESSNSIDDLAPGNYVVTVTDANGCSVASNYNIFEPAPLNVFVNTSAVNCFGDNDGQATAVVNGGTVPYTYTWNKVPSIYNFSYSAPNSVNNLNQGNYRVIVSDGNSCLDTVLFSISEPSQLEASVQIISPITCHGDNDGTVQVVTWGGIAPYSYSWSDGFFTNSPIRSNLDAGVYTVLVSDANNCSMNYSYSLSEPPMLFANIIQDTINQCSGSSANIFGQAFGGTAPYNFQWQNGATGNNALVQLGNSQNYWLRVTDINQCSVYDTSFIRVITPPSIELGPAISGCPGQQRTLGNLVNTNNVQYNWSTGQTSSTITVSPENSQFYSLTITDLTYGCSASDNILINIVNTLSVQVNSINHVSCFGLSNGSIDISVTGGTAPYAYQWINGSTTQDVSGLNPGLYLVEVTDANGCRDEVIITVNSPSALQSSITVSNTSCFNTCDGTATITSTGGSGTHTYTWSNGTNNSVASGLCPGIFTVTVNDQHGCSTVNFGIISQGPNLNVSYTSVNTSCSNNDGLVIVNTSNLSTPYYISTNAGSLSGDTVKFLPAGSVTVTVTDFNGCSRTDIVNINNGCNCNVQLNLSVDDISCFGMSDASVMLNANGGTSPYQYALNQQAPVLDSIFNNLSPGNYSFTAIDINGCSATSTINIPNKQALFGYLSTTNIECFGNNNGQIQASVTGGTSPYGYSINNGITWTSSPIFSGLAAGNYTITIKDANNCELSLNTFISSPSPISTSALLASAPLCYGDSNAIVFISINGGTAPFSLSWNDGVITPNQIRSNLYAGNHSVTVTDDNGCVSSASIIIQSPTPLIASIQIDTVYQCIGTPTQLQVFGSGGVGQYTYSWQGGETNASIQRIFNASQLYQVSITDLNGCSNSDSVSVVVISNPNINLGTDTSICAGQGITLFNLLDQAQYTYQWSTGASTDSINVVVLNNTTISVTATNIFTGCNASDNINILISNDLVINIDTIIKPSCFGYSDGAVNLSVSGGNGNYTYSWTNGASTQDLTGLSAGLYIVQVNDANGCSASIAVNVGQHTPLSLSTTTIPSSCPGACDGEIAAYASGGTGNLSYAWNNGSTSATISGICAATYTLTITDQNNCTASTTSIVSQPTFPDFVYEVNPTSCAGNDGTIIINNSNPSSTYTITSTQGTVAGNTILNLSPGLVNITITQANGCSFATPITITDSCICTISLGYEIMPITCFDAADAVVTLFSSGGNNTVLYSINQQPTSANNVYSGLDAGNYTFTAIDSNGCSASQSVTILEPQALFAYVNPIELNCFNDTTGAIEIFAVGGSNPYSYSINNGSSWTSNNVFDSLIAGNYTIIVKDALGCQISLNTSVNEPAQIANALIVDNPTCTANDGSITFISTGGVTPYTYSLNGITQANPTYNNLNAGTHYYTITDSRGCRISGNIILNPLNSFLAQINGLNSACIGTSRVYTAQASNGLAPFNFSWSTGQTTNTINLPINANTNLQVYVTDANGCRDTASMAITAINNPTLTTSPNLQICVGQSTTINASGASTYTWNNGNTTASQVVNPTQNTTYTVTGTNSAGCSSTRSIQITVATNPTANISGQSSICLGSNTILAANTASSYLWSNGATTQTTTISPSSTQSFQVTLTNSQGCTATATQIVSVNPIPSITVNGDTTLCEGDDLSLFINTPGFYSWHKNGNPIGNSASIYYPNASNALAGLYSVTFTNANGCSTTTQRQVSVDPLPPAQIVAQGATTICSGDSVLLVSFPGQIGNTYLWSNGETNRTLYAYNSGFYTITITNSNGCSNDATIFIFARPSPPAPIALDTNSCSGQNILLQGNAGSNLLFWYNNSNNIIGTGPVYATTPTLPGSYSYFLDALDAYGCRSARDTLQLSVTAPPAPAIVPNATICNGNIASLVVANPTFGVTYNWSSNGSPIATNTITTNVGPLFNNAVVEILATDTSSGCTSLSYSNIAIDDIISTPQVNNNVVNTCFNSTESIIAFGSSSPNHVLQWYINNTLVQTASNSSTDTLVLAGLTASTSIEIYEYDTLTLCNSLPRYVNIVVNPALAQPLLIPSNTTICQGSATTVQVNNPGNQTGQVAWYYAGSILSYGSSFNVSNSISNTPGNYTFLFRLENGQCASNFDSVTITINPTPSINTAIGDTICNGELANLRIIGNQGSIAWYLDPNGLSMVGSGNPISIPAFATTLYYARENLNGCLSNPYPVPVIVENLPAAPFLTGGTACEGQAIELTATGNGTDILVWEDFNNQIVQTDTGIVVSTYVTSSTLQAGLYSYHVHQLSLNGCLSLPTSTTVQITARPTAPVVADSTICAGSAISLFNSNSIGITRWYSDASLSNLLASGNSFNVLSLTASTTYYATNLDAGCESPADTVTITVLPNPVLNSSDFTTSPICAGTQALIAAVAPGNYTWYADPSGLSILGAGISYNTQTLYQNSNFYVQSIVGNCRSNILPVPVTVNQPPTVPVPLNASVCQGEPATLQVFVPNAADITWFNEYNMIIEIDTNTTNGDLIIPDTLSAGTYTFYANQSNNVCLSGLATVSLIVLPPSTSPPSDTIVICYQTSTTLAAPNGAFTYEWFDLNDNLLQVGPTFTSPLITDTVNYYLTATPNGGCTSLPAIYQVQARPSIGINNASSNGPVCVGDTLRLFAGTTIPNATYTWTGPAGYTANTENPVISYASANLSGIFIVAATSAEGCTESDTILVQVNQVISSAGIFGNNQICNGFDLGLLCNDLGSGATYTWFLPDGTDSTTAQPNFFIPAVNQSNTGFYGVAINFNGCTSTEDSMFVNVIPRPAQPQISGDTSYCAGEHLILNTVNIPSTVINWILPNGSIRSFVNRIDIDPVNLSDDGIYRIYYFDGTCPSDTAFVNVNVNALPDTSLVTISTNGPLCDGDTLRISASNIPSDVVYSWTDPLSNIYPDSVVVIPNATGLVNLGNYNFYMMSMNGCTSPAISEYVFIAGPPELTFVRSTVHACEGFSFQLFADTSEFVTYSWNGPNGFSSNLRNPIVDSATVNMSGTYTVQAFRGTCASPIYSTIMSVTPNPIITTLTNDTLEIEVGTPFELDADGGLIYEWSPPFYLNAVSIPNPTVLADTLDFVSYVVTGYDNQFCSSTDTLHVQFIPARKGEGVDLDIFTIMTPNGDGYNDTWHIGNIQNLENYTISIFDRRGIELYQTDFYQNNWDGTFNGKPLPEGSYWYIIRTPIREYKGAITILR